MRRIWLLLMRFWKRWLPQTLFGRSLLILILPVFLSTSIGLFVFFDRHWTVTTARLTDSLAGEIALIVEAWERAPNIAEQQRLARLAQTELGLTLTYKAREILPQTRSLNVPGLTRPLEEALARKLDRSFAIKPSDDVEKFIISFPVQGGILTITLPQKRLFSTTTYVFLLFMVGSGLLLSVLAIIFMRNQIRPVNKLALAAEQFGKGIDMPNFKPAGAKEVRQAGEAFLEMRDRIRRQIKQRTDMLAGVSHDLRTPLTRMKLQLAFLPQNADSEALTRDIDAMEKMITGYLDFARNEQLEQRLRCDVLHLLQGCFRDAEIQGLKITAILPDTPVMATVRPQALQRAFTNLLDNARLYARQAWVTAVANPSYLDIVIDDNGPGIPAAKRAEVFKPFQRLDDSRNQDIGGTGLGLTITNDIIQSHGGTVILADSPQKGLRITVQIPL